MQVRTRARVWDWAAEQAEEQAERMGQAAWVGNGCWIGQQHESGDRAVACTVDWLRDQEVAHIGAAERVRAYEGRCMLGDWGGRMCYYSIP